MNEILNIISYYWLMIGSAAMCILFFIMKNGLTRKYMIALFASMFWGTVIAEFDFKSADGIPDWIRVIPICVSMTLFGIYSYRKYYYSKA